MLNYVPFWSNKCTEDVTSIGFSYECTNANVPDPWWKPSLPQFTFLSQSCLASMCQMSGSVKDSVVPCDWRCGRVQCCHRGGGLICILWVMFWQRDKNSAKEGYGKLELTNHLFTWPVDLVIFYKQINYIDSTAQYTIHTYTALYQSVEIRNICFV